MKAIALSITLASSWLAASLSASAQIVPDGTVNTLVTPSGNTFTIDGGTTAGTNLFHSFSEFSLPTGSEAFFNNAASIDNILTRVTGGSISNIDGLIRANGTANLFLLNPNGIVFGPNARLNIGGSFISTTAETVQFADGVEFSSTDANPAPLLSVSVPVGLQFGQNPGDIIDRATSLEVPANNTIALLGGNVSLESTTVFAPSGRIEIGSVGGNQTVNLTSIPDGFALGYDNATAFGDISIAGNSIVEVTGAPSGDVRVQGRAFLLDDSRLIGINTSPQPGGDIQVNATDSVTLVGSRDYIDDLIRFFANPTPSAFPQGLLARTEGSGTGGNVIVNTARLQATDGIFINTTATASGAAGDIAIDASESYTIRRSQVSSFSTFGSDADTGSVTIDTGRFSIAEIGANFTEPFGNGTGGNVVVNATESLEIVGAPLESFRLEARPPGDEMTDNVTSNVATGSQGTGVAGDLIVSSPQITLRDGGTLFSTSFLEGRPGNIFVEAGRIEIDGEIEGDVLVPSTILAGSFNPGVVTAPFSVSVVANEIVLRNGAQIRLDKFSMGESGDLSVVADSIALDSGSQIESQTAFGDGSNLSIQANSLMLRDGSTIDTQVGRAVNFLRGNIAPGLPGDGGNISIDVDRLDISGDSSIFSVGAIDPSLGSSATLTGGNIALWVDRLRLEDGGRIFSSNLAPGTGGNIALAVGMLRLDEGQISAETAFGEGANIAIGGRQTFLRDRSQITTTVGAATDPTNGNVTIGTGGSGGNISIDVGPLIAIDNSDIFTDVLSGSGGQIDIDARAIVGLRFRNELTEFSDIATISTFDGNSVTLSCGDDRETEIASKASNVDSSSTLEEATQWFLNDDGAVTLSADRSTTNSVNCQ